MASTLPRRAVGDAGPPKDLQQPRRGETALAPGICYVQGALRALLSVLCRN